MILICRHGETQWNTQKRKQGRKDSPLTLKGINQGIALAQELKNKFYSKDMDIISSPLFRTRQYASIISDIMDVSYSKINFDERLKEHSFGLWEGLNEIEIEKKFPGMVAAREANWWSYKVPEGESYELLEARLLPFVEDLDSSKDYIFIAHEMVSKVLRKILLGLSESECLALKHHHNVIMNIDNKELSEVKF